MYARKPPSGPGELACSVPGVALLPMATTLRLLVVRLRKVMQLRGQEGGKHRRNTGKES
jgi:hypothetical protein